MGLLDRVARQALIEAGARRGDAALKKMRPSGYTQAEWEVTADQLTHGNRDIGRMLMAEQSDGVPANAANWEWGGYSHPDNYLPAVTSHKPHSVEIPMARDDYDRGIMFHSHPSDLYDATTKELMPNPLSTADLGATAATRGITSLDAQGGFGVAIKNPRGKLHPAEIEMIYPEARSAAQGKAGHNPVYAYGAASNKANGTTSQEALAAILGMGRGLKNAKLLEEFDYLPGSEGQIAALAKMEPAIDAAAQKAEEIVRTWLKARGITDKDLVAFVGTLGTGGMIALADQIEGEA